MTADAPDVAGDTASFSLAVLNPGGRDPSNIFLPGLASLTPSAAGIHQ